MRRRLLALFCAVCSMVSMVSLIASCGIGASESSAAEALRVDFLAKADEVTVNEASVTFTDASGSEAITIAKNPTKTVSLYASLTTLWYEAGGEVIGCIGGASATELYTEAIGRDITQDFGMTVLAKSASGKQWDVESILALMPDLILCSTAMSGYETIKKPAAMANIPLIAVEYNDFSDYLKWFKVFCHLNGRPELWETVAIPALNAVVAVLAACPNENTPSVLCLFAGASSIQANTSHTVIGGMLHAMNASNRIDSWGRESGVERIEIDLEMIYAADPDIILIQCHAGVDAAKKLLEACYGGNPVWEELRAVKENRVYYLEKTLFHNKPNSRFSDAYSTLFDILYPAAAAS